MMRSRTLVAVATAAVMALAGCSNGSDSQTDNGSMMNNNIMSDGDESPSESFNAQDVTFLQTMIPHHEQAIVMADMAQRAAQTQQLQDLADRIEAAQQPEIDQMKQWLLEWGEDVPEDDPGGMDHSMMDHMDMDDMAGMMSDADLDELRGMSGTGFDRMWLVMMIAHHEGAIEMAQVEQVEGENADAIALAETIEADQTAEIAYMERLIDELE